MVDSGFQRRGAGIPFALVVCLSLLTGGVPGSAADPLVEFGSQMRFLDNSVDPGLATSWFDPGFDDTSWVDAQYGLGYENETGVEDLILTPVPSGTRSVYSRAIFHVNDVRDIGRVLIGADYDDGWVAWINGVEVFRSPEMPPETPAWDSMPSSHEASNGTTPQYDPLEDISAVAFPLLHDGDNLLAVGGWNVGPPDSPLSSDMLLVPFLGTADGEYRAPYLQSTTPTSTIIRWRSAFPTESLVLYGSDWGDLESSGASVLDTTVTTEHIVEIDNLDPGTRYYYAVGSPGAMLAGDDEDHFVETHPLPGPPRAMRIWVLGDSGFPGPDQQSVRDSYYAFTGDTHTDLWLHMGDVSQSTGTDAEYQLEFFDAYQELMCKSAIWPTLGNHDAQHSDSGTEIGPYYSNFSLPTAGEAGGLPTGTEAYYSFDFANIHFVVLNSMDVSRSPFGEMLTWLELDLASTAQDWIIAYWHHPPYTKGSHDSDDPLDSSGSMTEMRQNALPILDDYGVDLVLGGHSHSYERSFLLDGHYGTSDTLLESMKVDPGDGQENGDGAYQKLVRGVVPYTGPGDGIVYTVAGSGSATWGGPLDHPVMSTSLNVLGSLVLDVDGLRLDASFVDNTCTTPPCTSSILDSFTILKDCPSGDADDDGICGDRDNCPDVSNPGQEDNDDDGVGNVCDDCPEVPGTDLDGDLLCGAEDNCPLVANPDQLDSDGDGEGDACDTDDDNDGVEDIADCAPLSPAVSSLPGAVGNTLRLDRFAGSTLYWDRAVQGHVTNIYRFEAGGGEAPEPTECWISTTFTMYSDSQLPPVGRLFLYLVNGENACGAGPLGQGESGVERVPAVACTPSPEDDFDVDSFPDLLDNCSQWPNPQQKDVDRDFVGNACDNCRTVSNSRQEDCNDDGEGDVCDADSDCDVDSIPDADDNCPTVDNPGQEDLDGDLIGDVCDACENDAENDIDLDGICGDLDNCPHAENAEQTNTDGDAQGDACDSDDDNDGVDDGEDCAPLWGSLSGSPDPIGPTLRLEQGEKTRLFWLRSYQGYTANLYKGTLPTGQAWLNGAECEAAAIPGTEIEGTYPVFSGAPHYFLVSARNACGESEAGHSSSGDPTPVGTACPSVVADSDSDGIDDLADNCALEGNPGQEDADGDFVGDACDNCGVTFNPDQADGDGNGIGDACEP